MCTKSPTTCITSPTVRTVAGDAHQVTDDRHAGCRPAHLQDNVADKVFEFAADENLDRAAYDECVAGEVMRERVRAQAAEAASLGINGTPSFVINGRILRGAQPAARFRAILDDELTKNGS